MAEMTFEEGLARAQAYCATAERCSQEVCDMLARHNVGVEVRNKIVGRLVEDGFVDEQRYARAFVHDKICFAKWGRRKIGMALRQKRISDAAVSAALADMDMEEYMQVLRTVTESQYRKTSGADEYTRSMKTLRSVAARGFEPDLIMGFLKAQDLPEPDII